MSKTTENTLENKAKFFALYWEQRILTWKENETGIKPVSIGYINDIGCYLELKPISSITDEDYNKLHNVNGLNIESRVLNIGGNSVTIFYKWRDRDMQDGFGHSVSTIYYDGLSQFGADFLRSRGYALPWMGLSVEQLIEYGWIKLKEG